LAFRQKAILARLESTEAASRTSTIALLIFRRDPDAIFPHSLILAKMCPPRRGLCVSIFKCRK
jgi:hypothetical protein